MLIEQLGKQMNKAKDMWCQLVHDQPMWPINGHYQCRTCLRYHAVVWEDSTKQQMSVSKQLSPSNGPELSVASAHQ